MRFGWATTKSNIGFFVGLLIATWLLNIVSSIIANIVTIAAGIFIGAIFYIASYVLGIVVSIGLIKIPLRFCDNEKARFADLFSHYHMFFKYLFGSILYVLIVFGGIILLIIPGIIWAIRFGCFGYLIVDKELGPVEALKKSFAITKGATWDLFIFGLLLVGINLLGVLSLLVGLFVTIPITMVATAYVYRRLLEKAEVAGVPAISYGV